MVSSVGNSLNSLFASSFSEVTRTTALTNPKSAAIDALKRIAPELPSQAVEAHGGQQQNEGKTGQQGRFGGFDDRQPSLSDYIKPKATISPADEAALFSIDPALFAQTIKEQPSRAPQASYLLQNASDERTQEQLSRRKQSYVAQLYAQASDITFSSDSFVNQAA